MNGINSKYTDNGEGRLIKIKTILDTERRIPFDKCEYVLSSNGAKYTVRAHCPTDDNTYEYESLASTTDVNIKCGFINIIGSDRQFSIAKRE